MSTGALSVVVWLLPLVTAVVVGCLRSAKLAHYAAAAAMAVAAVLAASMAVTVVGGGVAVQGPHALWLDLGSFTLGVGTLIDPMSAVMATIVCVLAAVVLVFNAWYMHDDPLAARFPWQFCGFVAAMLGVVLSDNLFLTFCCWELVGLGSYLLIGFWFDKPAASDDPDYQSNKGRGARGVLEHQLSPAHAQLKAFVMNRVGDAGFLLGIGALLVASLLAGRSGDVLAFSQLSTLASAEPVGTATFLGLSASSLLGLGALGIFAGAIGKSAQFPLHTWLPDAMQGPTTASSIIHAATMVAAGVFLVARCYPLFSPDALLVVGWTGGITCLLAASIACVQWDLKAVLAYSTVSQLGLMFVGLAAGAAHGGRDAGLAHLFTHAFAKCLLFLCAGAVIHAVHGCQDLHRLGGLKKRMPITAWASLLAVLALGGFPLLSGFFSKDAVLAASLSAALADGGAAYGPFVLASVGSLLTAAYMLRWWLSIFAGRERDAELVHHAHDPSPAAAIAMCVLLPFTLALPWTIGDWLHVQHGETHGPAMVLALSLLAIGGVFAGWVFWWAPSKGHDVAGALATNLRRLHVACSELWGIDRLWDRVFTRGLGRSLAKATARLDLGSAERLAALQDVANAPDEVSLDGLVDDAARGAWRLGRAGSWFHGGGLTVYVTAAFVLATVAALVGALQ